MNEQIQKKSIISDSVRIKKSIMLLKATVDKIQAKDSSFHIIFFEMPINHSLMNLAEPKMIRETFLSIFPQSQYQYIFPPDSLQFETTDGNHLSGREAHIYTDFFRSQMN